ncbi:MAG: RHS repeat-associated core domain-containing protein [Patescibacteria group bacterium]
MLSRTQNYKNNYLFTGKEKDEESDLQYFEARYYSPTNGRFYSQDRVFWEIGQTK